MTLSKTVNRLKPVLREDDLPKRESGRATSGARRGSAWTAYRIFLTGHHQGAVRASRSGIMLVRVGVPTYNGGR
jgi:hypothetical protein